MCVSACIACHCFCDPDARAADEKNDKLKTLIKSKIKEYLDRAEKLKVHISNQEQRSKSAIGADGKPSAGKKCVCPAVGESPHTTHSTTRRNPQG